MKNGYCRVIDGQENTVDFGIFKDDKAHGKFCHYDIEIPDGKYQKYNIDETFKQRIGIYADDECVKLSFFNNFDEL
jgi:hypothetical protein